MKSPQKSSPSKPPRNENRNVLRRPFVTANFAATWDGRVTTQKKTPVDFTSPRDKQRLLEIRATGDALLVGAGTVATDNMAMGMPSEALRRARLERGQSAYPLRVILTNSGRLDPGLKVFQKRFSPIIIFSTKRMPEAVREALASKATLHFENASTVDLRRMLATLRRKHGVRRVVCEGGPQLFRSLLENDLIDEIHMTFCPRIFGSAKAPTITGPAGAYLPASVRCTLRAMEVVGDECFLRYRVVR